MSPSLRRTFRDSSTESVRPTDRKPSAGEDPDGSILDRSWEWTKNSKGKSIKATPGPLQNAWFLVKRKVDGLPEPVTTVEAFYMLLPSLRPEFACLTEPNHAHYLSMDEFVMGMKNAFRKRAQQVRSKISIKRWWPVDSNQPAEQPVGSGSDNDDEGAYTVASIIDDRLVGGQREYKVALQSSPLHCSALPFTPLHFSAVDSTPLSTPVLSAPLHSTLLHSDLATLHSSPFSSTPFHSPPLRSIALRLAGEVGRLQPTRRHLGTAVHFEWMPRQDCGI